MKRDAENTAAEPGAGPPSPGGEKYQRILDAAVEVIAENGYFNSPVSAIAARAGVADGTIYLYFKSKDEVLRTAIDAIFARFHRRVEERFRTLDDPRAQLQYIAELHLESGRTNRNMAILMQTEMRQSAKFIAEFSHHHLVRYIQMVREVVRRGQARGIFRGDVSDGLVAHCMFGAIDELLSAAVFTGRVYDAKTTAAQVMDVLLKGITAGIMALLNVATINDVLARIASHGNQTVMMWQDAGGEWKPITSAQLYGRVRALGDVLTGWGIGKGDRVALIAENRWEWAVTDFAVLALGAVDVPLYPTLTTEHVGYMLRDSGAKVVVVSSAEQYKKITEAGELPALEHVVVMDAGTFEGADSFASLMTGAAEREAADAMFDTRAKGVGVDDLATIIYTSGTTGEPKGVMLTQGNLASNVNVSTDPMGFGATDSCISFLPLSHVTARHTDYALLAQGVRLAYCPKMDALAPAMQALKPTVFLAVPRVYEKIRQAVEGKSAHSPVKSRILKWALGVGRKHWEATFADRKPGSLSWKLAEKLVYGKIRAAFGGRVWCFISGGAPLGMDTAGWFADAGIRILEGYGLTETSPVIAVNYPGAYRIGTVGKALPNVECRFAADGELEVRGPSVFRGYWNKPKETAEAFTEDGWFKTGDIGHVDAEGFLSITDRKKELLKTSGGKLIAPQPIENKLKANTLVAQAAMVGDKHKFACVLISPNFAALEAWAKAQGITTGDRAALVKDERVTKLYHGIMEQVNSGLAQYESMKRCTVVPDEWSVEDGTLTPSMKLKRRVVEKRYEAEIANFYKDEATVSR